LRFSGLSKIIVDDTSTIHSSDSRIPVSGSDGKTLKSQEQEAQRWKQHFQDILNCPEPTEVHEFYGDCNNVLDIGLSTEDIS